MTANVGIKILALALTAIALVPSGAHLLELPNKMRLTREEYVIAQTLYRGWQFVGVVVVAALVATGALDSHAASAILNLAAVVATSLAVIWGHIG